MKLRHSTICTLYSSTKFEALVRTKCIRRNMRSTCQWSCVLQFTWRRAVCCGLHRPMSQVIPCLGLKFSLFLFHNDINLCFKTQSSALSIGISKLPWRNPLETNNILRVFIVACEYQGFLYKFFSLFPSLQSKKIKKSICEYTLMILPQVHLRKPCYDF